MNAGRLIAVVGPSGAGKDSLIAALCARRPDIVPVRRVITRAMDELGEAHEPVEQGEFARRVAAGAFCLHWHAHGLSYGIPDEVRRAVAAGGQRIANLSRAILPEAAKVFPGLCVLHVTASPEVLVARLAARGREDALDIARRLARAGADLPTGPGAITIDNDGALDDAVAQALRALYPVRA